MKKLGLLLLLLLSTVLLATTPTTGKFDLLSTMNPSLSQIGILKNVDIQTTGGLYIPNGTSGQRPSPTKDGMLRFNSTLGNVEVFVSPSWVPLGGLVDLASGVTGILPYANGGTNAATANGALNNLLPSQGSSAGLFLQTDGTNTSWAAAGGTLPTFTANYSLFGDGTNVPVTSSDFQFNNSTKTLSIGTGSSSTNGVITIGGSGTGNGTINGGGGTLDIVGGPLTLNTHSSGQSLVLKTNNISALTVSGTDQTITVPFQFKSTLATGTAPFAVASTTKVTNLYADRAALADTVTTNANLTGDVTSVGNATTIGAGVVTNSMLAGSIAYSKLNLTGSILNADISASAAIAYSKFASLSTGQILAGNAGVPTATTLSGGATIGATGVVTLGNSAVTGQLLTGYTSGAGTISSSDSLLSAIQKLNGNAATIPNLTGVITSVGNTTSTGAQTGTGSTFAMSVSPALTGTPAIAAATGTSLVTSSFIGVGNTPSAGVSLQVSKTITGSTSSYGVKNSGVIQSDVTNTARYHGVQASTAAGSYTVPLLLYNSATQGTFGAGSTVTAQAGYHCDSTMIGATSNYCFYSDIASGSGMFGLYLNGTAPSYFNGAIGIGTNAPNANTLLDVSTTAKSTRPMGSMTSAQKIALTAVEGGWAYDTDLHAPSYYNGTMWQTGIGTVSVDTDWVDCTFSTLAWQGYGTVTNTSLQCRRVGTDLLMKGKFTTGTVAASQARIPLPSNYGTIVSKTISGTLESGGLMFRDASSQGIMASILVGSGLSYVNVSKNLINVGNNPNTPTNGDDFMGSAESAELVSVRIPIQGWLSTSSTYSAASANYSRRAYTPTFTGFGTVTNIDCYESRDGEYNDIDCSWTNGTPTGVEARITLPSGLTSSALGVIRNAGNIIGANAPSFTIPAALIEPSVTYLTFGETAASVSAMVKRNGNDFAPTGGNMSMKVRVPISGWSNSSQIMAVIPQPAILTDVKASGTAGGTATSGSYQTRTLNTITDPSGVVVSLASNQFTLAGAATQSVYLIEASAPAYEVNQHKIILRNITDSTTDIIGMTAESSSTADYAVTNAVLTGYVTITSNKTYEIQHRVISTHSTNGFGLPASFGDSEVYTTVKITKIR